MLVLVKFVDAVFLNIAALFHNFDEFDRYFLHVKIIPSNSTTLH